EDAHVPGRLIIQLTPELTDAVNADAGKGAPFSRWAWPEPMREAFAELRVHAVAPVLPLGAASPEKLPSLQEVYARRHQRVAPQATLRRLDAFLLVELPREADLMHAEET